MLLQQPRPFQCQESDKNEVTILAAAFVEIYNNSCDWLSFPSYSVHYWLKSNGNAPRSGIVRKQMAASGTFLLQFIYKIKKDYPLPPPHHQGGSFMAKTVYN